MERIQISTHYEYLIEVGFSEYEDSDLPVGKRPKFKIRLSAENHNDAVEKAESAYPSPRYSVVSVRSVSEIPVFTTLLTPEEVSEVARLYHQIKKAEFDLKRADYEGPNGIVAQKQAVRRLADELIPRYKEKIPKEIQDKLGLDIGKLEEKCR